ncbi:MAG: hypothetical protein PHI55_13845 [Burkholderiaceae bacterium]|nr:hypothetical protein [Burkholderiaceae bacterium]
MTSSPTPSSPTPSRPRAEVALPGPAWLALALLTATGLAQAHGEASDVLPPEPGLRLDAAAAVSALHSGTPLPSQRLRGFLLQGDAGTDRNGLALEHGTVGLSGRLNEALGASVALGKHGSDPTHIESAWVQWRHDTPTQSADHRQWWLLTAGRQRPALGTAMGQAGHFDTFGLMPLAKQMALNGDWIDDGLELGWRQEGPQGRFSADLGLWKARVFPGGEGAGPVPSIHLGWAQGPWAIDGWAARFTPTQRGSLVRSHIGHSHAAPECTAQLRQVVCFGGASTVAGASAVWRGAQSALEWPLTLTASGWLRDERGSLESANGLADYQARNRGAWVQGLWAWAPGWETGARLERAWSTQVLQGPGATLIAKETELAAYRPAQRAGAVLAWQIHPKARLSAEWGREQAAGGPSERGTTSYALLRLVVRPPTQARP